MSIQHSLTLHHERDKMNFGRFNTFLLWVLMILALTISASISSDPHGDEFSIWVASDSHVLGDWQEAGYKSLEYAIHQSETGDTGGVYFDWDIGLQLGDFASGHYPPDDPEGYEVTSQLNSGRMHRREDIYCLMGNHDASAPAPGKESNWWFRKYVDPMGRHFECSGVDSTKRPFPITGAYDHYYFTAGNVLVIMLSDRNDGDPPEGRGQGPGGYPAGRIDYSTFNWWKDLVLANQDKNIITCAHHMLRSTTLASGRYEGILGGYHGKFSRHDSIGSSYLYWVGDTADSDAFTRFLEDFQIREGRGAIAMWIGGHTHPKEPDDRFGGKGLVEKKYGVTFINAAALTKVHTEGAFQSSRLITFSNGSQYAHLQMYIHDASVADIGWYQPADRYIMLPHRFRGPNRNAFASSEDFVQLSPNPTKQQLMVLFRDYLQCTGEMTIHNIKGQQVFNSKLPEGIIGNTIDVSGLNKGLYIVQIMVCDQLYRKKLVIG